MHIDPTGEQVSAFAERDDDMPVFMLNLLRFKPDGGAESYATYAAATAPHLRRVGGEIVWSGACDTALIGPGEPEWDVAAVVRYPSRARFLEMVGDPEYQAITHHRTGALVDSRLIPCAGTVLGA
ncbi:DUF1330 domain-containing protein [Paraconexibacter sp.]|uniref:DUF1330 domain-containing protein n=1 Tax=Paraconexibacter sp. TaxID=2949640 RepID=UPI00356B2F45